MKRIGRLFRPYLAFSADAPARAAPAEDRAGRFRALILPHMDAAYTLARYLARDPVLAEDIVQEAFLRAFRAFDDCRGEAPRAWLLAIVRNCFLSSTAAARPMAAEADAPEPIDRDDPEVILLRQREAEHVRETIANLPEPFREAIVLRDLEELSYKEIAAITEVPIGTVMSRLARARRMLGDLLLPSEEAGREATS